MVVSNNVTAKKVPKVPGLLQYREDLKKLFLRANKTWSLLPQEKEVNSVKKIVQNYLRLCVSGVTQITTLDGNRHYNKWKMIYPFIPRNYSSFA